MNIVFEWVKHCNEDIFKRVVDKMKQEVYVRESEKVCDWWKMLSYKLLGLLPQCFVSIS